MSARAARLFSWLQDARFYRDMHLAAAGLVGGGDGRSWLDVGCGPGLLARVAASKGYAATGIDRDPDMIDAARRIAAERRVAVDYRVSDIEQMIQRGGHYDVVSASSLLVVVPDPIAALHQLLARTKPGGTLLIVEAAREMTRRRAIAASLSGQLGHRSYMLPVWAMFRSGRTLDEATFAQPGLRVNGLPLLNGLARAWAIERA